LGRGHGGFGSSIAFGLSLACGPDRFATLRRKTVIGFAASAQHFAIREHESPQTIFVISR